MKKIRFNNLSLFVRIINVFVIFVLVFFFSSSLSNKKQKILQDKELLKVLENAKKELSKKETDSALKLLIDYRKSSPNINSGSLNSIYLIRSIGNIYLKEKNDPDAAILFFSEALKSPSLSDPEFDIIRAWLGRAKEWNQFGEGSYFKKNPKFLYFLGEKYYKQGLKSQKYLMDISASADFSLASSYLIPFTIYFDKDPRVGEALYMMGDIQRRSRHNNDYWNEYFYLIEVIMRFSNTELAAKSYSVLYEDIHFSYTGSSGDNTPPAWSLLLKEFLEMSKVKSSVSTIPKIIRFD